MESAVFKHLVFIFILMAMGPVGCGGFDALGGGSDGGNDGLRLVQPYGTCDRSDVTTINLCAESVGSEYNDAQYLSILQSSCESTGGVFSTANCDRTGAIGSCIIGARQAHETHVTYYPPEYDAASAAAACAGQGGAFRPL
jgi:hypothetical protein